MAIKFLKGLFHKEEKLLNVIVLLIGPIMKLLAINQCNKHIIKFKNVILIQRLRMPSWGNNYMFSICSKKH